MWVAQIATAWTGTGAEDDANRPLLGDAYTIHKYEDVTGQPAPNLHPSPNTFVALIECEVAVLDAIDADLDYLVLWAEEKVEEEFPFMEGMDELPVAARARSKRLNERLVVASAFGMVSRLHALVGRDRPRHLEIPANEFGQWRAYMARLGMSRDQITGIIGAEPRGRSRSQLSHTLRDWMFTLPKA